MKRNSILLAALLLLGWFFCLPRNLFKGTVYSTVVESAEGELLGARIAEDGQWRFPESDSVPYKFAVALIEFEDQYFTQHKGVNLFSLLRAVYGNIKSGKITSGGSTITMQLAKNLYFRFTHNYLRKTAEILIALALERKLGKERILDFYINIIYFGNGTYGLSEAARFYFSKPVSALTLNQMFLLACLPAIPTRGNPIQYPEVFERVRNKRLNYLLREKKKPLISQDEAAEIFANTASCLDPELRKPDEFTRSYPQTIPRINERFGRFAPKGRKA